MRKEVIFAILIGAFIGLAIAFGLWRANKAFLPQKQPNEATETPGTQNDQQSTENKIATSSLLITQPENGAVVSTDTISVEGSTFANSTVVIATNADEAIVQADKDGTFSADIKLGAGANQIKVTSFDKDGNEASTNVTVVYSTELENN